MSRIYTYPEAEEGVLEKHSLWEPPGGSGVYRRSLWFWKNFASDDTVCDLLIFLDGQNLFKAASLGRRRHWNAERHFAQRHHPLLVVGVPASVRRYPEYIGWSREPGHFSISAQKHAYFLVHFLLPYVRDLYPRSQIKGLIGASAGGVAALYTAWSFPRVFPAVGCLSAGRHYFSELLELYEGMPAQKLYLSCGDTGMDAELLPSSKKFAKLLRARKGLDLRTCWHRGKHSEVVWSRRLPDLLDFFLGEA